MNLCSWNIYLKQACLRESILLFPSSKRKLLGKTLQRALTIPTNVSFSKTFKAPKFRLLSHVFFFPDKLLFSTCKLSLSLPTFCSFLPNHKQRKQTLHMKVLYISFILKGIFSKVISSPQPLRLTAESAVFYWFPSFKHSSSRCVIKKFLSACGFSLKKYIFVWKYWRKNVTDYITISKKRLYHSRRA